MQARFHFHHRSMAIGQLAQLRAQLGAMAARMPREAMAPALNAEQQLLGKIAFHEGEMTRAQQALAAAQARSAAASAELRALQLQSGQMYSAIKVSRIMMMLFIAPFRFEILCISLRWMLYSSVLKRFLICTGSLTADCCPWDRQRPQ